MCSSGLPYTDVMVLVRMFVLAPCCSAWPALSSLVLQAQDSLCSVCAALFPSAPGKLSFQSRAHPWVRCCHSLPTHLAAGASFCWLPFPQSRGEGREAPPSPPCQGRMTKLLLFGGWVGGSTGAPVTQVKAALCHELAGCSQAFWRGHGRDLEAAASFPSQEGSEQAPVHPPPF